MRNLRVALALVIIVALLIFSINNAQTVSVIFFSYRTPPLPLFLILGCSFLLGFLAAFLLATVRITRLRRQLSQSRRKEESGGPSGSGEQSA